MAQELILPLLPRSRPAEVPVAHTRVRAVIPSVPASGQRPEGLTSTAPPRRVHKPYAERPSANSEPHRIDLFV